MAHPSAWYDKYMDAYEKVKNDTSSSEIREVAGQQIPGESTDTVGRLPSSTEGHTAL